VEILKTIARQRMHANQEALDFDNGQPVGEEAPIVSSRAKHLWEVLCTGYGVLGLDRACGEDEVFRLLALARVVEPVSKLDSIRVLTEIGIMPPSYPTIKRRLPVYATEEWRQRLAAACAAHVGLGPATLVIYDVTTLYFETDQGDGFREPGFSKERRLEPQITVGLLTDARGFPLMVHAFEGDRAECQDHPAGGAGVRGGPSASRGDRGRRCRHALRSQPGRAGGCRAQVHRRRQDSRGALPGQPVAKRPSR
jgi:hypothetical protein